MIFKQYKPFFLVLGALCLLGFLILGARLLAIDDSYRLTLWDPAPSVHSQPITIGDIKAQTGYILPVATNVVLGGVKQGANVTIAGDGAISVSSPITSLSWSSITAKPTTLAGYGITDAQTSTGTVEWSRITSTPTTLAGYGISDSIALTSGSYANPIWITSLAYTKLTGAPSLATVATSGAYTDLNGRPTIPAQFAPTQGSNVSITGTYPNLNFSVTGLGSGTVTSAALSLPSIFTVTGSPVTTAGTLTGTLATQAANTIFCGPTTGSAVIPVFRSLVSADIPSPTINDGVVRSIVTTTSSTGFQVSSTRPCSVTYPISLSTTASISGPASVLVYLETANTNSTTPSDWTTLMSVSNTQSLSLAVVLQSIQGSTVPLSWTIPAGKWVRIRSSISGTGSASILASGSQEVIW